MFAAYQVPDMVFFEIIGPNKGVVDSQGHLSKVTLFPTMFTNTLRLPFSYLVREMLDLLGLTPSQLHHDTWRYLTDYCVLWLLALQSSHPGRTDLTGREFLLTHKKLKKKAKEDARLVRELRD